MKTYLLGNILRMLYLFRNTYIHRYLCTKQQLVEKEAVDFKETKEGWLYGNVWRNEGEGGKFIVIV